MSPLALVLVLSGIFFALFVLITGAVYFARSRSGTPSKAPAAAAIFGGGSVAIVEVNGVIMDSKKTLKRLERVEEDSSVKAVVLRLNSPGGSVAPSQEIFEAVRKLKKPVVASMGSVAASGAFYIAMGAKKVYANPGTITGSIGVIMEFANLEKLYEWAKIKRFSIKTGKFKDAGSEYREMTAEDRALLQGMVDNVLVQFKQAVSEGRKLPMEEVARVADGRIFSGQQAKELKMVDELGTLQDAIEEAGRMGGIKGKPKVVTTDKPKARWLELLLEDSKSDDEAEAAASPGGLGRLIARVVREVLGESISLRSLEDPVGALGPGIYWIWNGAR